MQRNIKGGILLKKKVYKIGIPTIAGSGSEASRTVLTSNNKKKWG